MDYSPCLNFLWRHKFTHLWNRLKFHQAIFLTWPNSATTNDASNGQKLLPHFCWFGLLNLFKLHFEGTNLPICVTVNFLKKRFFFFMWSSGRNVQYSSNTQYNFFLINKNKRYLQTKEILKYSDLKTPQTYTDIIYIPLHHLTQKNSPSNVLPQ